MEYLSLTNIYKKYDNIDVLKNINLSIKSGELIVFVGPSGCGKSTLLRCIAGLEELAQGEISIDGENVVDKSPANRGIAMVFQSYALYPHMSVYDNIAFNLKLSKVPETQIQEKVTEVAKILHLEEHLSKRPKQLSGGQRQRVAIGRAIVRNPKVFLFDEPLSNLDAALRTKMRIEIARLHKQLNATMVYVTHDQTEAMTLSDRIVVLNQGEIEQVGAPMELYNYPQSLFVATFIGNPQMNIFEISHVSNSSLIKNENTSDTDMSHIGIRPEHFVLTDKDNALLSGRVDIMEQFGEYLLVHIKTDFSQTLIIKVSANEDMSHYVESQQDVYLSVSPKHLHFFDSQGKRI